MTKRGVQKVTRSDVGSTGKGEAANAAAAKKPIRIVREIIGGIRRNIHGSSLAAYRRPRNDSDGRATTMARVTTWLIVINVAVFGLQQLFSDELVTNFALWPLGSYHVAQLNATVGFHWWQLLTSAFLHANVLHIGLNMYALYLFGFNVERTMGAAYYLALYFAAVLASGLVQLGVVTATVSSGVYPTLGASGGIFGVLLAFGVLFPERKLILIFPPIPLPAWLFVTLYGLIELASGIFGTEAGVAHFAHLGGMLGGALVLWFWRRHVQLPAYDWDE